jgi:hypothetical protein
MGKVNIVGKMVHHMTAVLFKEKDKELVDGNLVKKIMMYILEVIRMIRNLGKGEYVWNNGTVYEGYFVNDLK